MEGLYGRANVRSFYIPLECFVTHFFFFEKKKAPIGKKPASTLGRDNMHHPVIQGAKVQLLRICIWAMTFNRIPTLTK